MKIALSRLNTGTLSCLAGQLVTDSKPETYTFIKDHPLLTTLQTTYARFNVVIDKQSYSGKGKLVAKANIARNNAFNCMKHCLSGLAKVDGNSLQADANDLYSIFKSAGLNINQHKYMTKSTELGKLIEVLEQPENALKIEHVHMTEIFGILKAANISFEKLALEQMGDNAKLRQMGTASALRKDLETTIHNYLSLVTAMKEVDGWKKLYMLLNEHVKKARNSHRKTHKDITEQDTNS